MKIAILHQSKPAPVVDGIVKPMKKGGYSDSGADIAFELSQNNVKVITPIKNPDVNTDTDWTFPDSSEGIKQAMALGADAFWLNTVLYAEHPITKVTSDIKLIGQSPQVVERHDDKWGTNQLLKENNIPIPQSVLVAKEDFENHNIPPLSFPVVVKPLRGRGSQGVQKVDTEAELNNYLQVFFSENTYGDSVYLEQYLNGMEITITVMPAGRYNIDGKEAQHNAPWCLPIVKRYNHVNGIAPYSGVVAVTENSSVIDSEDMSPHQIEIVNQHCIKAAQIIGIKAPIRIDARADRDGNFYLFDLNLKPNMTGPSRPHRKGQDSLSLLAARAIGWNYFDFLQNILNQWWGTDG